MTDDVAVTLERQDPLDAWKQPYEEYRILAGFLRKEDVSEVYPAATSWPPDVLARVEQVLGAGFNLPARPDAGRCPIHPVEESEALAVLRTAARMFPLGPNMPFSYSWIEPSNLIATASISGPIDLQSTVVEPDDQSLAYYSLFGPLPRYRPGSDGSIYFSSPLNAGLASRRIVNDQLVLVYKLSQAVHPIIVGYEQGRFYLLNAYRRVVSALAANIQKLLCLVHYGLDLTTVKMGVRLFETQPGAINHFGHSILSSERPPMVSDFLDDYVSVVFPAKASFFILSPSLVGHQVDLSVTSNLTVPLRQSSDESTGATENKSLQL